MAVHSGSKGTHLGFYPGRLGLYHLSADSVDEGDYSSVIILTLVNSYADSHKIRILILLSWGFQDSYPFDCQVDDQRRPVISFLRKEPKYPPRDYIVELWHFGKPTKVFHQNLEENKFLKYTTILLKSLPAVPMLYSTNLPG